MLSDRGNAEVQKSLYLLVDESNLFEEGEHYAHLAGQDLTDALEDAPHGEDVLERFPIIGELKD